MPPIDDLLQELLLIGPDLQWRLLATVVGIAFILILRWLILRSVNVRVEDTTSLYRWRKGAEYTTLVLGIWLLGRIWFSSSFSLSTYLGLLSAGLAVALHDPITNLVGWLFIIWRRPFSMGDRIQVDGQSGDVIDMGYFQFKMLEIGNWVHADQSTGRVLHVPNRIVFSQVVANYSKGFNYIWNEIPVTITFESDWQAAKQILNDIVHKHMDNQNETLTARMRAAAQQHLINYERITPIVYTEVVDSGIKLTMRYLCEPRQRRATAESIWENVLNAFNERADVQFAYPTQRLYYQGVSPVQPPRSETGAVKKADV